MEVLELGPLDNAIPASVIGVTFEFLPAVGGPLGQGGSPAEAQRELADSMETVLAKRLQRLRSKVPEFFGRLAWSHGGKWCIRYSTSAGDSDVGDWLMRQPETAPAATQALGDGAIWPMVNPRSKEMDGPIFRCSIVLLEDQATVALVVQQHHMMGDMKGFGILCRCLLEGSPAPMVIRPRPTAAAEGSGGPPGSCSAQSGSAEATAALGPPPEGMEYTPRPSWGFAIGNAVTWAMPWLAPALISRVVPRMMPDMTVRRKSLGGLSAKEGGPGGHGGDDSVVTLNDVVTARIWRALMRVRGLKDDAPTRVCMPVDVRRTYNLDPDLIGNPTLYAVAATTVGELCNEPLEVSAARIRTAVLSTRENAEESLRWLTACPRPAGLATPFTRAVLGGGDVGISSWLGAGLFDLSWRGEDGASLPLVNCCGAVPRPFAERGLLAAEGLAVVLAKDGPGEGHAEERLIAEIGIRTSLAEALSEAFRKDEEP